MKAVLLAAGVGSRLRPLTDAIPKCLVPIKGKPLLEIWLELLEKSHIQEVLINTHAHTEAVRSFLVGRFRHLQVTVTQEPQLLGSGGTLRANRNWIGTDQSFWILYADVLTAVDLQKMLRFHQKHASAATLGVCRVPDPKRCGIAVVNQHNRIEKFVEKPENPPGDLAFAGIMVGTQLLLDAIPHHGLPDIGFDVLPRLAGQMYAYPVVEYLLDIGTMENYARAQMTWTGP